MRIYLVRHGQPNSADIDPAKGLSENGRAEITRLANSIRHLNIKVENIYHSSKTRALQTAMLLSNAVKSSGGVSLKEGITPNDPVEPIAAEIEALDQDLMIVGHLPFMGRLASMLLIKDNHKNLLDWHTGSMACIEYDGGSYILQWFINPDVVVADIAGQFKSYH